MPRGTVKTFEPTKGFGTLSLESGEELPFDISASNKLEIRVGDSAEITIGIGYTGKPKAKMLVFEVETDRAPTFQPGFRQLQSFGFLQQWDLKQAKAAAKELLDDMPAKLLRADTGELLRKYYGEGISELGKAEGVLTLDWRFGQVTQKPVEDLLAIASNGWSAPFSYNSGKVTLGQSDEIDLAAEAGLAPLLVALNSELETANSDGRYFSLDFDGDYYVIVYRAKDFAAKLGATTFMKLG